MTKLATITTASGGTQRTLERTRIYSIINKDLTDSVYLSVGYGIAADGGDGEGKYILTPGEAVDIGPGETILTAAAAANTPKIGISSVIAEASVLAACGIS